MPGDVGDGQAMDAILQVDDIEVVASDDLGGPAVGRDLQSRDIGYVQGSNDLCTVCASSSSFSSCRTRSPEQWVRQTQAV